MPNESLKTKWPPGVPPEAQLQRLFTALLTKIGPQNIEGLTVFVQYQGESPEGGVSKQQAVFTAGSEVDAVYDWMREVIKDAD